ncbi:MAG: heme-binding protein [Alphaproteobacteria bacterium]|nr:heme-binding protein [Alphaproteobacteria bacterium]
MTDTVAHLKLTLAGAQRILAAAQARAQAMGVPQNIVVTDDGGHMLAMARMDGAKPLSVMSAFAKAKTAASARAPTGGAAADVELKLALAQDLHYTNLRGGLPIIVDGKCIGAIGVGSGTGDQDVEVAKAGLAALAGASIP